MKKLIEKLSHRWDILSGRYQFLKVENSDDLKGCLHVLNEVRLKELNRVAGKSVLDSHALNSTGIDYSLMACRDTKTDKIVGCIKVTKSCQVKDMPYSVQEYRLDVFPEEMLDKLWIFTRLAVLKSYRKSPVSLLLLGNTFAKLMEEGCLGALLTCEPSLYSMYKSLGMRPIGSAANSPSGGYRIPMIFFPDLDYLKKINSPALLWSKYFQPPQFKPIIDWYEHLADQKREMRVGVSMYREGEEELDHILTAGLSDRGKRDFLKNAISIKCRMDDVIVAANDGGKVFGLIKKGVAQVVINGQSVALLSEGAIFGEIAFLLDTNRTATLIAADDETEVLLFSASALKRLADHEDQVIIWRNLAKVVARRLVDRTAVQ